MLLTDEHSLISSKLNQEETRCVLNHSRATHFHDVIFCV